MVWHEGRRTLCSFTYSLGPHTFDEVRIPVSISCRHAMGPCAWRSSQSAQYVTPPFRSPGSVSGVLTTSITWAGSGVQGKRRQESRDKWIARLIFTSPGVRPPATYGPVSCDLRRQGENTTERSRGGG